jgi:predicted RecB family nuclease
MRRAAKVDGNHGEIVAALRKAGAGVCDLSAVGQGCPDLLVSYRSRWHLVEVKDGSRPPSERRLTPRQTAWHDSHLARVHVVNSVDEALEAIGAVHSVKLDKWLRENI